MICGVCGKESVLWDSDGPLMSFSTAMCPGFVAACPDLCDVDDGQPIAIGREIDGTYHIYDLGLPEPKKA